jgi:hypothetical protein
MTVPYLHQRGQAQIYISYILGGNGPLQLDYTEAGVVLELIPDDLPDIPLEIFSFVLHAGIESVQKKLL